MKNGFYNDFDVTCLERPRDSDYRTPFQKDRDRIIHSSALRRLQSKTQVFLVGEYDFYRTRLTHSLEVAQVGKSLCAYLRATSPDLSDDFCIDTDLVEGICLAHDIGHPPFGHAGEKILNNLMHIYGGFEGNAQTLRLISETISSSGGTRTGINPTRAFTDGVMKYKRIFHPQTDYKNHFLYEDQQPILAFVFGSQSTSLDTVEDLNDFRSIECEIMNWADDAAYSLNDISDGINGGFLTVENLTHWCDHANLDPDQCAWSDAIIEAIHSRTINKLIAQKIGSFIAGCSLTQRDTFMSDVTNRYRFHLVINDDVARESEFYKTIARKLIFESPRVHQLQFKAQLMLERLFHTLCNNYRMEDYLRLVPRGEEDLIVQEASDGVRTRLVCDYIAGMTDGYAIRTYRRLFDPNFGSIADLV